MNYTYRSGLGAAVVAVPTGIYLVSASATAAAPGATIQIGVGDLIPVPVNGSATANPNHERVGPLNVTFVGTTAFLVEMSDQTF